MMTDENGRAVGFADVDRNMRRQAISKELKARKTGRWEPWERVLMGPEGIELPGLIPHPDGWTRDVHTVHRNGWCIVMVRTCKSAFGYVQHAAIKTVTDSGLGWAEKQRIKDEIFGKIATAIEVFPAADRLVDAAPLYHLWILPLDKELPFGLHEKDPCSGRHYRP